jgi:hypothetical protein
MKPTKEQLEEIKEKYIDVQEDILLDSNNRPYVQTDNGKMYLSAKNKYHYTIKN